MIISLNPDGGGILIVDTDDTKFDISLHEALKDILNSIPYSLFYNC